MTPFHEAGTPSLWRHHRVTLIVYADACDDARQILRCAAYDARSQLRNIQEQPLGIPAVKHILSGEFCAPLGTAAVLLQELAHQLGPVPVVLIRLETLGSSTPGNCNCAMGPDPKHPVAARQVHQHPGVFE